MIGVKKTLIEVPVRKPARQEFVRSGLVVAGASRRQSWN
jgi:hypothetical protein